MTDEKFQYWLNSVPWTKVTDGPGRIRRVGITWDAVKASQASGLGSHVGWTVVVISRDCTLIQRDHLRY